MSKFYITIKQHTVFIMFGVFIFIASFSAGFLTCHYLPFMKDSGFKILKQAHSVLVQYSLNELPEPKELEYGMIRGMLQVLDDPYTTFVEPVQHELQTNQLEGKFGGIGARLERDSAGYLLLYPFPGSAADNAGIGEGDRLIAIEEMIVKAEMGFDEIQAAIRGPVGESLQLTISKAPSYEETQISVKREEVFLPSVTWNVTPDNEKVGIIQINIIAATTPDEVKTAILDLQDRDVQFFILDLRNNAGGYLHAGVDTASLFLEKSIILQQQYKGKDVENLSSKSNGEFLDIPLVVLVNNFSASAAEIIAGALQKQERAVLIGSNTYGKDSIQMVFDLDDGSSMHVTAAKWWIPGFEYPIAGQGITPDIVLTNEETNQPEIIQTAIEIFGIGQ